MVVVIKFPSDGTSRVSVYKENEIRLIVDRKFIFGSKIMGDFYKQGRKIATVKSLFFGLRIYFQDFEKKITVRNNNLFFSTFIVDNDKIKITNNLIYFLYPKFFSKIYWNNQLVANVSIKKLLDIDGITLEVKFKEQYDDDVQYYSIILYLMTSLNLNI